MSVSSVDNCLYSDSIAALSNSTRKIYYYIQRNLQLNHGCFCSDDSNNPQQYIYNTVINLSKRLGLSRQTIYRSLEVLKKSGICVYARLNKSKKSLIYISIICSVIKKISRSKLLTSNSLTASSVVSNSYKSGSRHINSHSDKLICNIGYEHVIKNDEMINLDKIKPILETHQSTLSLTKGIKYISIDKDKNYNSRELTLRESMLRNIDSWGKRESDDCNEMRSVILDKFGPSSYRCYFAASKLELIDSDDVPYVKIAGGIPIDGKIIPSKFVEIRIEDNFGHVLKNPYFSGFKCFILKYFVK